ncbi:Abortive infection bacteriophage resistance protein [Oceanospirillum multiglobuliferum]|uniref:Abortive phage infection protein n=1 Tax=Oceanospirillum multiglobuliferum TaxID=64969 RepID=A0A1T4N3Y4_9GAMM|nr:Abi family protein [Oceanospirillum multiglobuliferum]OPX55825.1 abortive phage infection protein [Oceanospirillum multiglobuliferum]SJZ73844.1 Abortive infection bacteriophage resistance protein [Oceanospirillum multiglobuliferum]
MTEPVEVKPFFEYDELIQRLTERGMLIKDPLRAQRKLTQVGYYRLSGYWHTSRKFSYVDNKIKHQNEFQANTYFENIFEFYLFDKRLRVEFTDALERIEIYLRTIIAHEIGRTDPLAYLDKKQFSKAAFKEGAKIHYESWLDRHNRLIDQSKEDSIKDHRSKNKPIPLWVAVEAWDFGALSKFYSILSGKNQDLVCNRLGLDNRIELDNWLINLSDIRNRCAHHARLCNRSNPRTLKIPKKGYFNLLGLSQKQKEKFYGMIAVIWFLLKKIGPSSKWICRIADLIDQKPEIPGFTYKSMGLPETGFPRKLFPETIKAIPVVVEKSPMEELEHRLDQLLTFGNEYDLKEIATHDSERLKEAIEALTEHSYELDALIDET